MNLILGLDPGPEKSGWILIEKETYKPCGMGITDNISLYDCVYQCLIDEFENNNIDYDLAIVIEDFQSYGKYNQIGESTIRSIWWAGRFYEMFKALTPSMWDDNYVYMLMRRHVKLNLCEASNVKDTNVSAALAERFAPGQKSKGKGTKKEPGWFYGFRDHIWSAYALAVTQSDILKGHYKL